MPRYKYRDKKDRQYFEYEPYNSKSNRPFGLRVIEYENKFGLNPKLPPKTLTRRYSTELLRDQAIDRLLKHRVRNDRINERFISSSPYCGNKLIEERENYGQD